MTKKEIRKKSPIANVGNEEISPTSTDNQNPQSFKQGKISPSILHDPPQMTGSDNSNAPNPLTTQQSTSLASIPFRRSSRLSPSQALLTQTATPDTPAININGTYPSFSTPTPTTTAHAHTFSSSSNSSIHNIHPDLQELLGNGFGKRRKKGSGFGSMVSVGSVKDEGSEDLRDISDVVMKKEKRDEKKSKRNRRTDKNHLNEKENVIQRKEGESLSLKKKDMYSTSSHSSVSNNINPSITSLSQGFIYKVPSTQLTTAQSHTTPPTPLTPQQDIPSLQSQPSFSSSPLRQSFIAPYSSSTPSLSPLNQFVPFPSALSFHSLSPSSDQHPNPSIPSSPSLLPSLSQKTLSAALTASEKHNK